MANACYMTIIDDKGQQIKGNVKIKDREHTIEVVSMRSKVHIPVDPETNEARGVRTHEGFEVTKVLDQSTPAIYGALAKPKRWGSVQIDTYQVDENGNEVIAYTDKMEDVAVVGAESQLHNVKDSATKQLPQVDIVTFRYSRITRTWHDGNHTITDDWKASRTGS